MNNSPDTSGGPVRELDRMLAGLDPWLDDRSYRFVTGPSPADPALATFAEDEGWSSVVADPAGDMRRIVLRVHSSLEGVGLTAAVATTLAQAGIPCNMVAAFHHDHLFVPAKDAKQALELLSALQRSSRAPGDDRA